MTSSGPESSGRSSPLLAAALLGLLVAAGVGVGAEVAGRSADRDADSARAISAAGRQAQGERVEGARVLVFGGKNKYGIATGDRYSLHPDASRTGEPPDKADRDLAARVVTEQTPRARWSQDSVTAATPLPSGRGAALVTLPPTPTRVHHPWLPALGAWLLCVGLAFALAQLAPAGVRRFAGAAGLACLGIATALTGPVGAALGGALVALLLWRPTARVLGHLLFDPVPYYYVMPALIGLTVLIMVPFSIGVGMSLFKYLDGAWSFVGLSNFVEVLSVGSSGDTRFYWTLFVTILWTGGNVFFHVAIGLALALLLKDGVGRLTAVYRVLLVLPWAIPNYITALTWKGMFNKEFGAVNAILRMVGMEPVDWLGSTFLPAFSANLVTNTWLGFPFMMVVSLGALQSIPEELYEAAKVDGASAWTRFVRITLPLLKPALFPAVILGCIWTFNMFNIIYLVSGGAPNGETDILITEAYRAFRVLGRYGYAAAYSSVIFVILLTYTIITNRLTRSTEGAFD